MNPRVLTFVRRLLRHDKHVSKELPPFHFLNILPEIRNMIYAYALGRGRIYRIVKNKEGHDRLAHPHRRNLLALLLACQRMYIETCLISFIQNTVAFATPLCRINRKLTCYQMLPGLNPVVLEGTTSIRIETNRFDGYTDINYGMPKTIGTVYKGS